MQATEIRIIGPEFIGEHKRRQRIEDATRQITRQQIDKLLQCPRCQSKPIIYLMFKKEKVGVCADDWERLADTVLGWSGSQ